MIAALATSIPRLLEKFRTRIQALTNLQFSIHARSHSFVLSVMPHRISYLGVTSKDLNCLRQAAVQLVLKRHWLEPEIMPYVLRYLGISTVLDPGLSATTASLGFVYWSEGNVGDTIPDKQSVQDSSSNFGKITFYGENDRCFA